MDNMISLDVWQVIVIAMASYFGGWVLIRVTGGGYVTKKEFKNYTNMNEIVIAGIKDNMVKIQQRYAQEKYINEREGEVSSVNVDGIIETGIKYLVENLINNVRGKKEIGNGT